MKTTRTYAPVLLAALLCAGAALADEAATKKVGGILVDHAGMTLYTFDKDGAGKSACNGPCATAWPPLPAPASTSAPYSVVTRDDGSKQLAYQGKPLYLFAKDQKPGERNGDDMKQVWHVVKD